MNCTIKNCKKIADARGMCRMHYTRWKRHGDPFTVKKYDHRTIVRANGSARYVALRTETGNYKFEHVVMAERALGRDLPAGVVVHHVDGDGTNNNSKSRWNIVVCPDQEYHLLLHARARALGYEPLREGYKLTFKQAMEIRKSTESREVLARHYGVTVSTIKETRSSRRGKELERLRNFLKEQ